MTGFLYPTDLHVGITKRLKTVEVLEGESWSFECVLSHESESDPAVWTVGGKTVGSSGRFRITRQGRKYTLTVKDAALSDAGEVVFSVMGLTSKASLIVRGGCCGWGQEPNTVDWGTVGMFLGTVYLSWWGPNMSGAVGILIIEGSHSPA